MQTGDSSGTLHLYLRRDIRAWSTSGANVVPKSKKARALLALLALSEGYSVGRTRAAGMLWSNLERTTGLARLRNTLHNLQRDFDVNGLQPLRVDDQSIALKAEALRLDIEHVDLGDAEREGGEDHFLSELEGIDPALDRWLRRVREERLKTLSPNKQSEGDVENVGVRRRLDNRPKVAITEIENVGADVEALFARAVTEEIGSALARMRWFETITRNIRGDRLKAGADDISSLADYLLVGTLQSDGDRYRLLLKLLDVNNAATIVWVESFEEPVGTSFTIQRKLANVVAARLDTDLMLIEAERLRYLHVQNNDAYTLVLLAVPAIYRLDREPFLAAGNALTEATTSDRDSALAHSWLAYWNLFLIGQSWASNPFQSMVQAGKAAERAMMLDPLDARAMTIAGHVKAFLYGHLEEAATLHQLAIKTNPALALAWHLFSNTHTYAGRIDEAFRSITHCFELAPRDPHAFFAEGMLGIIRLLRGEYAEAAAVGRTVTERHPQFSSAYKSYLSALGHLGQKSEAAATLKRLRELEPNFSLQRFKTSARYQRAEDLERFMIGLRLAGVT